VQDRPSTTAEVVCWFRALDQQLPPEQRVVDDAYAARFLTKHGRAALRLGPVARHAGRRLADYIRARHRFIDDVLVAALPDVDQVALVGAGYDARAWRFAEHLGGTPWFEVDHPATAARKAKVVARHDGAWPRPDRRVAAVDLRTHDLGQALTSVGFVRGARTFFIWEGVSMYLSEADVSRALSGFAELGGPGSRLALDFWTTSPPGASASAAQRGRAAVERFAPRLLGVIGEPFLFATPPSGAGPLLARSGWAAVEIATARDLASRHDLPDHAALHAGFVVHAARAVARDPERRPVDSARPAGQEARR
jgi:methyltransferase (TIGR00027 family)